eukprot:SAG31_NODE_2865_length_4981_cov_4.988529_3_plen_117_part_00
MSCTVHNSFVFSTAGSGIGRACACGFAKRGWSVAAVDINASAAAQTAELCAIAAPDAMHIHLECDVSKSESISSAVATAAQTLGNLRAAINCAGIEGSKGRLHECDDSSFDQVDHV